MSFDDTVIADVSQRVESLYAARHDDVPFHGWHHVEFVRAKSKEFARELGANESLVEVAALVHDLNYLVDTTTDAKRGSKLRSEVLGSAGLDQGQRRKVEHIVRQAETRSRDADISAEAKALSDADTLFKALPITPVVLAPLYMRETGRSLRELAEKIVEEQVPKREREIYFYAPSAKDRYREWGDANLNLWTCLLQSLDDPDVVALMARIPLDAYPNGKRE